MVDAWPSCKGPRPRGTAEDLSGSGVGGRCARSDSIRAELLTVVRTHLNMRAFCGFCATRHRKDCELEQRPRAFRARVPLLPQRRKPSAESDGTRPLINQRRGWPAKVGQRCGADVFGALALLTEWRRGAGRDARVIRGCRARPAAGSVERSSTRRHGSASRNSAPPPGASSTATVPPCASATWRTIARPRPEPGRSRAAGAAVEAVEDVRRVRGRDARCRGRGPSPRRPRPSPRRHRPAGCASPRCRAGC